MDAYERLDFAERAAKLKQKQPAIEYRSITVYKPNVGAHIRRDSNKLYNFMLKLLILDAMAGFDDVTLIPDERSIKVKSGNSLHDYLQTLLWFEAEAQTTLRTIQSSSHQTLNLQFADMLAGAMQTHFERDKHDPFNLLSPVTRVKRLFFP